ncbi:hypothetical protein [Burkholderia sp. KJ006]|uniref:hypothetical protein n=1 Tax=Burkholderia sp. KJ006 TaxID=416344 RepID=UPI0011D1C576|nr:hypothetical protein [Burkholderia sp. KJ006]
MTTKFPLALIIAVTSAAISASTAITAVTINCAAAGANRPTGLMATPTLKTGPSIPVVDTAAIESSIAELKQRIAIVDRDRVELKHRKN